MAWRWLLTWLAHAKGQEEVAEDHGWEGAKVDALVGLGQSVLRADPGLTIHMDALYHHIPPIKMVKLEMFFYGIIYEQ